MKRHGWLICRSLASGLLLWAIASGTAGALQFQMFPEAEIQEAQTLRQRILAEVPPLDIRQRREPLSPESVLLVQQRLRALQGREAGNPFFHWAQGELLRQTQGPAAAEVAFTRARQTAGGRALIHWMLWRDFLARDLRSEAAREEQALQVIQLTWGLTRFPLLSGDEMRLAAEVTEGGDPARALALYDAALVNTPESPAALIQRASLIWQADRTRVVEVVRNLAAALIQAVRGRETAFRVESNLLLSLLIAWLTLLVLVAFVLSIKTQPLFGHELNERLLKAVPSQASLGLLLFVLPFMLGLGLLWAAAAALLLSAPYMDRRERSAASLLLAMLLLLPLGYEWVAARHIMASSHRFALVQAVERGGRGDTLLHELHEWVGGAPSAGVPRYYLALVLKRRGELAQAEAEMTKAVELLPQAGFVQVGLGNLRYLLGRLPEAEAAYRRAAEIVPTSAAVHLNLSELYTQRLQFDQSEVALARSVKLDPRTTRMVSFFHGQGLTGVVVDESVPWDALASELTPPMRDVRAAAEGFWGNLLCGVSLARLPYTAGLLLILFWAHAILRGRTPPVRHCQQCGASYCRKCQPNPKEVEYCTPCASVFRRREGVVAFVRGLRIREGEEHVRREHTRAGILGSVLPGGGDVYAGCMGLGLLLSLSAIWLFHEAFLLESLIPNLRFPSPLPGLVRYPLTLLLLGVLYLYSALRSWNRRIPGAH